MGVSEDRSVFVLNFDSPEEHDAHSPCCKKRQEKQELKRSVIDAGKNLHHTMVTVSEIKHPPKISVPGPHYDDFGQN
ncbi:8509_t:CDS:2 [Ambispora gerdemannii]|uniref:8509_t:CDS:1 n=1 Tax=Ambispora gerdemannii TaxID=144530 RepID=A0A9N8W5M7_9GLOM|nr:8509_t:CDS:2 [Ambispora gerdemannii]